MNDIPEMDVIEILNEYSSIVKNIARSAYYSSSTLDLNDLKQVGEIAVLQAIKSYDPSCGTTIKSFVYKVVRNEIFREAARFLGVFTVDHRVTSLAASANNMHLQGQSDEEIATMLNKGGSRNFDADHVKDLRIAYNRRHSSAIQNDDLEDLSVEESTIDSLLKNVINNESDRTILNSRILGNDTAIDTASQMNITVKRLYEMENDLKNRIRGAIENEL